MGSQIPYRQIRARYDSETITVYQAYNTTIADAAVREQKLNASPEFRAGRMTWIKPSWSWMMYRAGYSYKDQGQARILAIQMRHEDFIKILEKGVLTSHQQPKSGAHELRRSDSREKATDVRIQWDPERTPKLGVLPYRSIQIGIPGALSDAWANECISWIEDVTETARELKEVIDKRPDVTVEELVELGLVPEERPFEVPDSLRLKLQMDVTATES